jgi:dimethylargininase
MLTAIVREVSPSIARCELTHLERNPIDVEKARGQHAGYIRCLEALGCSVHRLAALPDLPDSVFVEDPAVVLDEIAVLTRPGAGSRRPEVDAIAPVLGSYRRLVRMEAPDTLDGGDVLRIGRTLYVGLTGRTGRGGVEQLARLVRPRGYGVLGVEVNGCLHLKSAVTRAGPDMILCNPAWVDPGAFSGMEAIPIDSAEPHAANGLLIGQTFLYPAAYPRTLERLRARGIPVMTTDLSELAKAVGAATCCCLIFDGGVGGSLSRRPE